MSPPPTLEEARARIEQALGFEQVEWWLDETIRIIQAYQAMLSRRRVYDISTVGARLRTAREVTGLSLAQYARRLNCSHRLLSTIELGKRDAPLELFARYCLSLGISQAWALGDSDKGGPPLPGGILRRQKSLNHTQRSNMLKKKAVARAELERLRGLRAPKEVRYKPAPAPTRMPEKVPCPRCQEPLYGSCCIADGCGYPGAPWTPGWSEKPSESPST
jgi:transcriptional regulator with XRE-family HTH domain